MSEGEAFFLQQMTRIWGIHKMELSFWETDQISLLQQKNNEIEQNYFVNCFFIVNCAELYFWKQLSWFLFLKKEGLCSTVQADQRMCWSPEILHFNILA